MKKVMYILLLTTVSAFSGTTNETVQAHYDEIMKMKIEVASIYSLHEAYEQAFLQNKITEHDISKYIENSLELCKLLPLWERAGFLDKVSSRITPFRGKTSNAYFEIVEKTKDYQLRRIERMKEVPHIQNAYNSEREKNAELTKAKLEYAVTLAKTDTTYFYSASFRKYLIQEMSTAGYGDENDEITELRKRIGILTEKR